MGSYMNLLTGQTMESDDLVFGGSQFASPYGEQEVEEVHVEGTPSAKPKTKRTKNFSEQEDTLLVSAWLEISTDAAQANEQSRCTYWQRIHEYFHKHKTFESDRSVKSLISRWSTILESVNRFCGCYTQIQNRNQSGVTEQNKVMHACELYKQKDPHGRSFGLLHCWDILQHEQKWCDRLSQKKQKTCSNSSPGTSTPGTKESRHDEDGECHTSPHKDARPEGKKKAKERQRRGKNHASPSENLYMDAMESMWTKKKEAEEFKEMKKKERDDLFLAFEQKRLDEEMALQKHKIEEKMALEQKRLDEEMALQKHKVEEKMALEKKKVELHETELEIRRREQDEKVMDMDLSGMSDLQQQYYRRMQEEIITRRFGSGSG